VIEGFERLLALMKHIIDSNGQIIPTYDQIDFQIYMIISLLQAVDDQIRESISQYHDEPSLQSSQNLNVYRA